MNVKQALKQICMLHEITGTSRDPPSHPSELRENASIARPLRRKRKSMPRKAKRNSFTVPAPESNSAVGVKADSCPTSPILFKPLFGRSASHS